MKNIELTIIPYAKENEMKTCLVVDGNNICSKDNRLTNLVVYQPMRKWLTPYKKKLFMWEGLLEEVIEEFNDKSIHFIFYGFMPDFTLFRKSILQQQNKLNRNGGSVDVAFDVVDKWNPEQTVKELIDALNDMRIEADNWGEDDIIKEIDRLKEKISSCTVALNTDYVYDNDSFKNVLQNKNLIINPESDLTIVPFDGNVPVSEICDFLAQSVSKADKSKKIFVINTSMQENDILFDTVISLYSNGCSDISYIESVDEDCIPDVEKQYYFSTLPDSVEKTNEILHMFPDYKTNSYLIDISNRIEDVFCINFK